MPPQGGNAMLRIATAAVLAALSTIAARAEDPLPRATPESVGMSSERLARLDAALKGEVERGRLGGAVVAIARRGKLVHYEPYGYVDPAKKTPMPRDGIFAIASMTKPLVGTAIMMLQEEGRLSLADPVERHIPELGARKVGVLDESSGAGGDPLATAPARRSITLLDLARHTSGITYGGRGTTAVHKQYPTSSNWAGENLTPAQFVAQLAAAPLLHQPGRCGITASRSTCSASSSRRSRASRSVPSLPSASSARSAWP